MTSTTRYFERNRAQGNLFWEVTVAGLQVTVRSGAAGALGKSASRQHLTAEKLAKDVDAQVKKQLAGGFVELTDEDPVWIEGDGPKPMRVRVPRSAERVRLVVIDHPQQQLDLGPLSTLKKLASLELGHHALQSLDLAPLAACRALKALRLTETGLTSVDLGPLARCRSLETLSVMHLKVAPDLEPLASAKSLRELKLLNNYFKTIDLTPLARAPVLTALHLQQCSALKSIDVTPLQKHRALELITVDASCKVIGEGGLKAEVRRFD